MFPNLLNPLVCGQLVSVAFSIGMLITFGEKLSIIRDYGHQGWHTWDIFRLDRMERTIFRRFPRIATVFFDVRGIAAFLFLGIAGAFMMLWQPPRSVPFFVGASLVFSASFVLNARDVYGGDGSQQMNTIIGASLLLGFNPWTSPLVGELALFFITAQACLAYSTSGIAKLVSPVWRHGDALISIFATKSYGSEFGYKAASYSPPLTHFICRTTVGIEVLFPLALFGPKWLLVAALIWGLSFHILNAFIMGLNTFLWAFVATYPAFFFTWLEIHACR